MDILQAMQYLKKGYKISRNDWKKDLYLVLNEQTKLIEMYDGKKKIYVGPTFTTIDVLKDDWQIYISEDDMKKDLVFTERHKIVEIFNKWIKSNFYVNYSDENFIKFLNENNLIVNKKARELLESEDKKQ